METVLCSMTQKEFTGLLKKCIRDEIALMKLETTNDELIRIEKAVELFKVSKVTLYKWRKKGILPFYKVSSIVYFKKSDLDVLIKTKFN